MQAFLVRRLATVVPVVLLVSLVAYLVMFFLPGDPAVAMLGAGEQQVDPVQRQQLREELGLNRPILVQYASWLGNALRGDLGRSLRTRQPVVDAIAARLPVTVELGLIGMVLAVLVSVPVGVISAVRAGSVADNASTVLALSGIAFPNFWLGIILIYLFSVDLHWLPASGYTPFADDPLQHVERLLMPGLVVAVGPMAELTRQVRGALLDVLDNDYIRTARAKGLPNRAVVARHALRNALIPIVTVLGLQVGRLVGGAVIAETVFSVPGMGLLLLDAISFRDFPLVQAVVLVLALVVLASNLVTDLAYAYLDPRIRYA